MSSLGNWEPHHNSHAILLASITIQFGQAVTDIPWNRILRDGRAAAGKAGLRTENQLTQIAVAFGPVPPNVPPPVSGGVEFLNLKRPDFFEEKLVLERNSLRYENWGYTRWQAFADRARHLVSAVIDNYITSVPLLGISVEYVDRFNAPLSGDGPDATAVVDQQSPLIAPMAFQPQSPWHTHSGWFDWPDEVTKRLVNADIDVADGPTLDQAQQHRFVQIRTAMSDLFNQLGRKPLDQAEVELEFLFNRCNTLHNELKKVLGVILTPEAAARISLAGSET